MTFCPVRGRKLAGFLGDSKPFLCSSRKEKRECSIFSTVVAAFNVLPEYQDSVVAAEVLRTLKQAKAQRLEERRYSLRLVETDFQAYYAVRFKVSSGVKSDGTVGIKPVIAAIQGGCRIVVSHFRLKLSYDIGTDIRRI